MISLRIGLWIRYQVQEQFAINAVPGDRHHFQEDFAINSVPGDRHHFQEDFAINSVPLGRFPRRLRDRFCDLGSYIKIKKTPWSNLCLGIDIISKKTSRSVLCLGIGHHFQEDFVIDSVPWDRRSCSRRFRDLLCAVGSNSFSKNLIQPYGCKG